MTAFEEKTVRHDRNLTFGPTNDFGPLFTAHFIAPADIENKAPESRDVTAPEQGTEQSELRAQETRRPGDLFGPGVFFERRVLWKNRGLEQPKSFSTKPPRASPSLFDLVATSPAVVEEPETLDETEPDQSAQDACPKAKAKLPEKNERQTLSLAIASGEKGKARDIL